MTYKKPQAEIEKFDSDVFIATSSTPGTCPTGFSCGFYNPSVGTCSQVECSGYDGVFEYFSEGECDGFYISGCEGYNSCSLYEDGICIIVD